MDRKDAIMIGFILLSGVMGVWFISQTTTEVYRQGEVIDQAFILQHEDEARENQTIHEDEAREIQFAKENEARDNQRYQIVRDTNKSINNSINLLEQRFYKFMNLSTERSIDAAKERDLIQKQISNNTAELLNLSSTIDKKLFEYGDNSIKQFQIILDNQKTLEKKIDNLSNK